MKEVGILVAGAVIAFAGVYLGVSWLGTPQIGSNGIEETNEKVFQNTVEFNNTAQFDGATALNAEVTLGSDNCSTATWNPDSVTSTDPAQVEVTMPSGYTVGDALLVSFSTNTQGLWLTAFPTGTAGTAVVAQLQVPADVAFWPATNIATATLKVCYFN